LEDKTLWHPQSAQIFCDDGFTPLTYGNTATKQLDPNDTQHDWQKGWTAVLQAIPPSIRHEVANYLIFTTDYKKGEENHSLQELYIAIKALEDQKALKGKRYKSFQKWWPKMVE